MKIRFIYFELSYDNRRPATPRDSNCVSVPIADD